MKSETSDNPFVKNIPQCEDDMKTEASNIQPGVDDMKTEASDNPFVKAIMPGVDRSK